MPTLYQAHRARWGNCTDCDLHQYRNRIVLARGSVPADILFVGEAPGASEDALGRPFIGPAGKLLDRIITQALGDDIRIAFTNIVACIPKTGDGSKIAEPPRAACNACAPRLAEFVALCRPQLVVCVGTVAAKWFMRDLQVTRNTLAPYETINVIHPAAILRMDISQQGLAVQRTAVALQDAADDLTPF